MSFNIFLQALSSFNFCNFINISSSVNVISFKTFCSGTLFSNSFLILLFLFFASCILHTLRCYQFFHTFSRAESVFYRSTYSRSLPRVLNIWLLYFSFFFHFLFNFLHKVFPPIAYPFFLQLFFPLNDCCVHYTNKRLNILFV